MPTTSEPRISPAVISNWIFTVTVSPTHRSVRIHGDESVLNNAGPRARHEGRRGSRWRRDASQHIANPQAGTATGRTTPLIPREPKPSADMSERQHVQPDATCPVEKEGPRQVHEPEGDPRSQVH